MEHEIVYDPENKVDYRHGYYMFFSSIISFSILNFIVFKIGKPKSVKDDEWRWRNLLISWIHGLICGTWDFLCLVLYPELFDDLFFHINYFTYLMVAFSTGYFVYDFLDLIVSKNVLKNWEVSLHHIAVASMFWYDFHSKMCIAFNVIALMAEINSFFLHSRKLMQMTNVSFENWLYRIVIYFNLATFLVCRGYSCTKITCSIFVDYDLVPPSYFYAICFSMIVMNLINPILFWRLLRNDVLRDWNKKEPRKMNVIQNGNNNLIKDKSD